MKKVIVVAIILVVIGFVGTFVWADIKNQKREGYKERVLSSEKHIAGIRLASQIINKYAEQVEVIKARTGKDPITDIGLFPEDRFSPVILRYRLNHIEVHGETPRDIGYDADAALRILIAFEIFIGPGDGKVDDKVIQAARFKCGSSMQLEEVRTEVQNKISVKIGKLTAELDRVRRWTWDTVPKEHQSQYRDVQED